MKTPKRIPMRNGGLEEIQDKFWITAKILKGFLKAIHRETMKKYQKKLR